MESLRILRLLYYKNFWMRRRQWLSSLLAEFLIPIGLILAIWAVRNQVYQPPVKINHSTYYQPVSQKDLINIATEYHRSVHIYYAPNTNPAVNELMQYITQTCLPNNQSFLFDYSSEEELIHGVYNDSSLKPVAVIFEDFNSKTTKKLKYKIRSNNLYQNELYQIFDQNLTYYYTDANLFTLVQLCLDEAFIQMKSTQNIVINPDSILIQQLPLPPYIKHNINDTIFRQIFASIIVIALSIPLFIETLIASNERFLGVNVLMSMNGVSNSLNLFSWLTSNWLFLSISIVLPTCVILISTTDGVIPFLNYTNPFIFWIVFNIHVAHLLAYGLHISAYFSKSLLVIFGLLIVNVGSLVLQQQGLNESSYPIAPYLGIILPNLMIVRVIEELNYYESIGSGIHWNNLFVVGKTSYKFAGSTGMVIILSIIGLIFHFIMVVYLYAINPGKYGVKKHPLFFLKSKNNKTANDNIESVEENGTDEKLFESDPRGAYTPGIIIRNLKKAFNISLFRNMKVHALRGVSINFYKGQITSLLGHNGAGKTTMMSILAGMMSPSDGIILINSKDMKTHATEILNDMGLCMQENMLFPNLSVMQQLTFFAMLKGKDKKSTEVKENVKALLNKLKLYEKRNVLPKTLSGGQKRRVCLGNALIGDPNILILDEPTSGLDPESRRVIWDILLKMRGQKTILISTHDMEEADILGDRIAIMHTGKLRSYGTSMFLKKLIGEGNVEVTLSVESSCDQERILDEFDGHGKIINADGSKIVISIPNSPELPDTLDKIEEKKRELGISGLSVSLISLEQVFLKVTQENDSPKLSGHPFRCADHKISESDHCWQSVQALLKKKLTYTFKNPSTIIIMLCLMATCVLTISWILKATYVQKQSEQLHEIKLNMYNQPEVFYKSDENVYGQKYKIISENAGGQVTEVKDTSISEAFINYGKRDFDYYQNHLIAAAEVNWTTTKQSMNAFYSNKATFSLPISVNLLTNTIAKSILGDEYSISLSSQKLPSEYNIYYDSTTINAITSAVIFCFLFFPTIALFSLHPLRETSTIIKQLQQMTGVSYFTYWGTMFIFDMVVMLLIIVLIIAGSAGMDMIFNIRIYDWETVAISLLLYVLFALNALPLIYCFSFIKFASTNVIRLLTYIPIGLIILELVMYAVNAALNYYEWVRILRLIQKKIFLIVPHVSFLHSQISFYTTSLTNARCRRMPNEFYDSRCKHSYNEICCFLGCYDNKCEHSVKYFTDFNKDITLEESLVYLCITPVLYFAILYILDNQIIQKLKARIKKQVIPEQTADEQVKKEKASVAQKISAMNGYNIAGSNNNIANGKLDDYSITPGTSNNQMFLVYEMSKQYGALMAVKDVSFGVNQRECFGLLGINGAGKSTTFRMMTGGEVPDSGVMFIGDKDIIRKRKYYLSQMGYCPQNDALIKSLNSYDHLRLFARLRGIPEELVETEVTTWINKLNLNACAAQPSGTYSGGNKRRLNIAIALIGVPNLVLLDEPTTGVDPGARHSLWNVIQSCQKMGQAVVLTSHSMEECEALCNRLAIMVGGRLVCIGPSQELKQRFGAGYDIQIKMNPEKAIEQLNDLKNNMMQALTCKLTDENLGYLMYHVMPSETTWRKMYSVMHAMKSQYDCIEDFSVLSSTLEQLFLLFARAANN